MKAQDTDNLTSQDERGRGKRRKTQFRKDKSYVPMPQKSISSTSSELSEIEDEDHDKFPQVPNDLMRENDTRGEFNFMYVDVF